MSRRPASKRLYEIEAAAYVAQSQATTPANNPRRHRPILWDHLDGDHDIQADPNCAACKEVSQDTTGP